MKFWLFS